ncbi:MAG: RNA polymerase sigma factor [Terracidiphilus sp.]
MISDRSSGFESDFLRMLETFGRPLRRLCSAYLRDSAEQEDLFQEIAIAIWTALPRFRGEASERTWIYRIAHNVAFTYTAKHRRLVGVQQPIESLPFIPATEDDSRHRALVEAVQRLQPADRILVTLYLEGFSAREIEEVTGLTANNVAVRLSRLRQKLTLALRGEEVCE